MRCTFDRRACPGSHEDGTGPVRGGQTIASATSFDDHVTLVTGGASGIGRALVDALIDRGGRVVVLDRATPEPFASAEQVAVIRGDVDDPDANRAAVAIACERFGGLDAFVGNAGVHDGGRQLLDLELEELATVLERVLAVNVRGYLLGARAAADAIRRRRGTMVFTLSDAAFRVTGVGAGIAYTVSKHAGVGIVRSLSAHLAPDVRVNGVAPGGVVTDLRAVDPGADAGERSLFDDPAAVEAQVRALNPLGVVLTAAQVVEHHLFLLSDASAGLTGHVLRPDGGLEAV